MWRKKVRVIKDREELGVKQRAIGTSIGGCNTDSKPKHRNFKSKSVREAQVKDA
jgi:hypothetical protein